MKEPTIIDRGTAAKLYAEGDNRVAVRNKSAKEWHLFSKADYFRDPCYEFALIDPEPEIVTPVVRAFHHRTTNHVTDLSVLNVEGLAEYTDYVAVLTPAEQHARKIELEDAVLAKPTTESVERLRDHLKAERGLK